MGRLRWLITQRGIFDDWTRFSVRRKWWTGAYWPYMDWKVTSMTREHMYQQYESELVCTGGHWTSISRTEVQLKIAAKVFLNAQTSKRSKLYNWNGQTKPCKERFHWSHIIWCSTTSSTKNNLTPDDAVFKKYHRGLFRFCFIIWNIIVDKIDLSCNLWTYWMLVEDLVSSWDF